MLTRCHRSSSGQPSRRMRAQTPFDATASLRQRYGTTQPLAAVCRTAMLASTAQPLPTAATLRHFATV